MATCFRLLSVFLLLLFFSCKKSELVDPIITAEQVYVISVTADRVDINYKLSNLGYQETGISYFKKSDPKNVYKIKAIRKDGILQLSMQSLDPNTEYVFKIFYKQNGEDKSDAKEHLVKTLSLVSTNFFLAINENTVIHATQGKFEAEIEGRNLQNLNLIDFEISVNNVPLKSEYPILINDNKYKIRLNGILPIPQNGVYSFTAKYQGNQVLFKNVIVDYSFEAYFLSYKAVNLRNSMASVFNNDLYYFIGENVLKWNNIEERMEIVGAAVKDLYFTIGTNKPGIQFENQLFFTPNVASYNPSASGPSDYYTLVEAYAFQPNSNQWQVFSLKENNLDNRKRDIQSQNLFIHNNELYFTYTLLDDRLSNPQLEAKSENYLYRYNKAAKQFQKISNVEKEIRNYHFVSIKNQLYLMGLVPVYDQGFKMGVTFCIYKINDQTFEVQEVYRKGDVRGPFIIYPKSVIEYDGQALIINAVNEFLLFNADDYKLSPVNLKNPPSHSYFGGTFIYNGQLHLNADVGSTSGKIYEISIKKER